MLTVVVLGLQRALTVVIEWEEMTGREKVRVRVGMAVGAVVVCDTAANSAEQLRGAARNLLSSFKVPTMWLLVDSDDVIPRGSTGKVDAGRLRELLAGEASRAQRFGE